MEEPVISNKQDNEAIDGEEKKPVWSDEQQSEFDRRASALKKSSELEGRRKAIAEFESRQATEKDALEKQRLADEGKYKDVALIAETAKTAAEKRADEAEQKYNALELQIGFDRIARSLNAEFANEQAAVDAFAHLDRELVGSADDGMKKAFEKLKIEHPHYFGIQIANSNTDASERGRRQTNQKSDEEKNKEIIQRFNIRRPR
jgi:hypothetical protein